MVMSARESQIVQVAQTPEFPRHDVMHVGEGDVGTAREATMSVSAPDLSALGTGREAPGPALVHGVPDVVVDRYGQGALTGELSHRLGVDQPIVLELTRQLAGLP